MDSYPFICGDCGSRHQSDQELDTHRCQGNGLYNQRDGGFFWTVAEHHTQTQPHGSLPSSVAGHQQATHTQTQPDSGSSAAAKQRKPKNAAQVPAIDILATFRLLTLLYRIWPASVTINVALAPAEKNTCGSSKPNGQTASRWAS